MFQSRRLFCLACFTGFSIVGFGASQVLSADDAVGRLMDQAKKRLDLGGKEIADPMRDMQSNAMKKQAAAWGHWGNNPAKFSTWTNHSNRLVPVYTFGVTLNDWRQKGSRYADASRLKAMFGSPPEQTVFATANYHDQIDVYDLQMAAVKAGKRHIITMVFDGMDWQTTRAAAIYRNQADAYDSGRGTGLLFQDYRGVRTDFAMLVTTPWSAGAKWDVNAQTIRSSDKQATGGFSPDLAGPMPWHEQSRRDYLIGQDRTLPHTVTDSASSATSLLSGIKTYNGAINVDADGSHVVPLARTLQQDGFRVGVVTSVPVSHATPACAYANNVSRKDYQDISRDMVGLPSASHRENPLPGLDVLIGGGWGEGTGKDKSQGENFMPGNKYMHESDFVTLEKNAMKAGEDAYVIAKRTPDRIGAEVLNDAVESAIEQNRRLLGFFGTKGGHLPFQTADGNFNPTFDVAGTERYTEADLVENPNVADMTTAALRVLSHSNEANDGGSLPRFWLLVEAGDVDWANHANNIDNSIGAVFSGEAAFASIVKWVEDQHAWDDTAVIVTSDHGHYLVIENEAAIAKAAQSAPTDQGQ